MQLSRINFKAIALKVILGLMLLGFAYTKIDLKFEAVKIPAADYSIIMYSILLFVFSFLVKYFRMIYLIGIDRFIGKGKYTSLVEAMSIHLISSCSSILLPFKLGDIFRAYLLGRFNSRISGGIAVVVAERVMDFAFLIFLALLLAVSYDLISFIESLGIIDIVLIIFAICCVVLSALFSINIVYTILAKKYPIAYPSFYRFIETVAFWFDSIKKINISTLVIISILTSSVWLLELSAFSLLYSQYEVNVPVLYLIAVLAILSFGLPAGPAGFGAVHVALYYAGTLGISKIDPALGDLYIFYVFLPSAFLFFLLYLLLIYMRDKVE